jgi:hypothetical protein
MRSCSLFFLWAILLASQCSMAQTYGSSVQTKDLTFPLPRLYKIPQLHTDMSLDCFIGYVAMDSLVRSNIDLFQALSIPSRASIQDLRFVARLIYGIDEYSHTLLNAHLVATRDTGRSIHDNRPFMASFYTPVMKAIGLDRWREFDPHLRALIATHYIYRIRVVNVVQGTDSSYGTGFYELKQMTAVYGEVLEKIKGIKIPGRCPVYAPATHSKSEDNTPLSNSPPCIAFSYSSRYHPRFMDVPQIGEEYYVFLAEAMYNYEEDILTIVSPHGKGTNGAEAPALLGRSPGMFRIRDGIVEDPRHFWSAENLTVEQFRTLLQSKITEIKSWTPGS